MSLLQTPTDLLPECQTLGWGSSCEQSLFPAHTHTHTPAPREREGEMSNRVLEKVCAHRGHIGHCGNTVGAWGHQRRLPGGGVCKAEKQRVILERREAQGSGTSSLLSCC